MPNAQKTDATCGKGCTCDQRASELAPPCPESYDRLVCAVTVGMLTADKRPALVEDERARRRFAAGVHELAMTLWLFRDRDVLECYRQGEVNR